MRKLLLMILALLVLCLPAGVPGGFAEDPAGGAEEEIPESEILQAAEELPEETDAPEKDLPVWQAEILPDGTAEIVRYNGKEQDVVIPEEVDGARVTAIGEKAFYRCESVVSVAIPAGVTRIGPSAFYACTTLTGAVLPEGIPEIADRTFSLCPALETVAIPGSVTRIGNWAFFGCMALAEIEIPEGVAEIGWYAFSHCTSLAAVTIPESVASVGMCAFSYCGKLKEASIPAGTEAIGFEAFDQCAEDLVIYAAEGSAAEQYCRDFRLAYETR